ncbi:MAG: hypothetical protein Ta2B_06540 [Termitinemataceae bacterium]|nr:MAG: hypothetical protein Ta2B_06540 [Termitinemataceae bacterium]
MSLFVDDIQVKNNFYAIIIRSKSAKGKLVSVQFEHPSARWSLITAKDIPGKNSLAGADFPVLAVDEVLYIGQPVAILVGPDYSQLEENAEMCKVIVEEATPSFDIFLDDAQVFETKTLSIETGIAKDIFVDTSTSAAEKNETDSMQQETKEDSILGNMQNVPNQLVINGIYRTTIAEHWTSEQCAAIAEIADNIFVIHTSTQWADHVKRSVSQVLGTACDNIKVEETDLGINFDGKIWYPSLISSLAAIAAFTTKKNVKLVPSREDDFLYSPKRVETEITYISTLNDKGQIVETDIKIKAGLGAYSFFTDDILDEICAGALGTIKLGHVNLSAVAVRTNLPPACPFAGFGASEGHFVLERQISALADTLREEPSAFRKKIVENKKIPSDIFASLVESITVKSDFKRKWASYEMLRHVEIDKDEKIEPMRGIAFSSSGVSLIKKCGFDEAGNAVARPAIGSEKSKANFPYFACAIVEIEINLIDYQPQLKGTWIEIYAPPLSESEKESQRSVILRSLSCALAWSSSENINYIDGKINVENNVAELIQDAAMLENVHIEFVSDPADSVTPLQDEHSTSLPQECPLGVEQNDHKRPNLNFEEIPFSLFVPAYIQAVSQAVGHNFTKMPVPSWQIWNTLRGV